ncbi:MAG: GlsB/YeaQ/YmgE family stress response membrane protein [Candidatus Acidiferrales bacterium]
MYLLSWIFIGLAAGWLAGKTLKGDAYGPFMDIVMGVGGAVAAGFIMRSVGFNGYRGTILTTLVAMIGAVLLTLLVGFVNGRRMSARQL